MASNFIVNLQTALAPVRQELLAHPVYQSLETLEDLQQFTQYHVFAVWDFMSLLKALQAGFTSVSSPWRPVGNPEIRRFINEIVLGEESDVDAQGRAVSHFELYLQAMRELGADTSLLERWLAQVEALKPGVSVLDLLAQADYLPEAVREFMTYTFTCIERLPLHSTAAVFTFGREDLIPDMFRRLVADLSQRQPERFETFIYYLDRHIEVDGDHHGPLSLRLMEEVCGQDPQKWAEAQEAAIQALKTRQILWEGILAGVES